MFHSQFFTCSNPHVDRCSNPLPWDPLSSPQSAGVCAGVCRAGGAPPPRSRLRCSSKKYNKLWIGINRTDKANKLVKSYRPRCSMSFQAVNHLRFGGWFGAFRGKGQACPYKATLIYIYIYIHTYMFLQSMKQWKTPNLTINGWSNGGRPALWSRILGPRINRADKQNPDWP